MSVAPHSLIVKRENTFVHGRRTVEFTKSRIVNILFCGLVAVFISYIPWQCVIPHSIVSYQHLFCVFYHVVYGHKTTNNTIDVMAHKFLAVKKHFQFVHVEIKVITIVNDVQKVIEWNNFSQQLMMKSFTSIANYMYYLNL